MRNKFKSNMVISVDTRKEGKYVERVFNFDMMLTKQAILVTTSSS